MNVVPPVPIPVVFNAGTVNTEQVKRDNLQREVIPAVSGTENSAAEKGVSSDSDRAKTPAQAQQQAVTYDRPLPTNGQGVNNQSNPDRDNANDESAGKESAEQRQQQQQEQAEQREITELKQRDAEVRAHEQAHAAVGGQYAGSPQYEFETGPDGRNYAVGGEVSIDISKESNPEDTLRKAQQVKAAALAPAEPSPQDLRVANEAAQLAVEARSDINTERAETLQRNLEEARTATTEQESTTATQSAVNDGGQLSFDLDDIVQEIDVSPAPRSLDNAGANELDIQTSQTRDLQITQRLAVIQNFYQQVAVPNQDRPGQVV
jgi:hypothetical protein